MTAEGMDLPADFRFPMSRSRILRLVLVVALLVGAAWFSRAPLLRALAWCWIVDEPVGSADAILVLGGGVQNRPFAAARLHREGRAPRVVLFRVAPSPTTEIGLTPTEQELARRVLVRSGVPQDRLVEIGNDVASSHDEVVAVRDWVRRSGVRRLVIPTDPFHTRRVRWLYRKELEGTGVSVTVTVAHHPKYRPTDWWRHEEGLIDFQNELVKFAYYLVKYGP